MVIRKDNIPVSKKENWCGGKGELYWHHFLVKEDSEGAGRLFALSVLPPGASIGSHTHTGDMEVYYILRGRALCSDNGEMTELSEGDVIITPNGEAHSIENIGTEDLYYLSLILFDHRNCQSKANKEV